MERPTPSPLHSQSTEPSPIPIHSNHLLHNPSLDSLSTCTESDGKLANILRRRESGNKCLSSPRYEILKVIGKGSFGQVLKVYDHKTHQHVALKMVRNEKRFHRQAQEEIRILEHLRKQDKDNTCNIIHMFDNFSFR